MRSVERGRWKLVSSRSTIRKRNPGVMKSVVSAVPARTPADVAADASGRSDGAGVAGVDRLVALAVGGSRCTPDVRRQRHLAMPFEVDVERRVRVEPKPNETPIALLHDRTRASIEEEPAARLGRMTGREL